MGKNLGEDLVFGSRAPGGQQSQKMGSRNMEIHLTATPYPLPDIPNHSEIILPVFLPDISSGQVGSHPPLLEQVVFPGISHS